MRRVLEARKFGGNRDAGISKKKIACFLLVVVTPRLGFRAGIDNETNHLL